MNGLDYKDWTNMTGRPSAMELLDWNKCLITLTAISYYNGNILYCYHTLSG
jgi:hypothetical protein